MSFSTDLLKVKLSGGDLSWLTSSNTRFTSGDGGSSVFSCSASAILDISWEYEENSSKGEDGLLSLVSSGGVGRSGDEWEGTSE